ncbi:unnamed protein product [Pseudo-nitzschia multistriata]|uniref:Carbohydrate sulfotransferase n=1 Tax=Pseudo-nitzschia multistriata TaxID=183589 RepID=A0A448ZIH0_9STRA|nr:unnamed protein product [Pseudo-nitzschia multistriata]
MTELRKTAVRNRIPLTSSRKARFKYGFCFVVIAFLFVGTKSWRGLQSTDMSNYLPNANELKLPKKYVERHPEKSPKKNSKKARRKEIRHFPVQDGPIDWSDKIFRRMEWDNDPVVIESHKLLFFTVPKNACSEFKVLFRRMMGFKDWKSAGSLSDKTHSPDINGLRYLGSYPRTKQEEFMTSSDWTRAIFVRDPMERLLSAYIDKAIKVHKSYFGGIPGGYIKNHCCGILHHETPEKRKIKNKSLEKDKPKCLSLLPFEKPVTEELLSFEDFVEYFMAQCRDPHWKAQSKRMTESSWKLINFVGYFDNLQEDAHRLLHRIRAFDEYGSGWGPQNRTIFEKNIQPHATSSKEKLSQFYSGSNSKLKRLVLEHYRDDYENPVMNLTKPKIWEEYMGPRSPDGM